MHLWEDAELSVAHGVDRLLGHALTTHIPTRVTSHTRRGRGGGGGGQGLRRKAASTVNSSMSEGRVNTRALYNGIRNEKSGKKRGMSKKSLKVFVPLWAEVWLDDVSGSAAESEPHLVGLLAAQQPLLLQGLLHGHTRVVAVGLGGREGREEGVRGSDRERERGTCGGKVCRAPSTGTS